MLQLTCVSRGCVIVDESSARIARELADASGVPVDLLDERWTTLEAERALREVGTRRGRDSVDALAATLLLRSYLDRRQSSARASGAAR